MRTAKKHRRGFDPNRCAICRRYVEVGPDFLAYCKTRERQHLDLNGMLPRVISGRNTRGGEPQTYGGYFETKVAA